MGGALGCLKRDPSAGGGGHHRHGHGSRGGAGLHPGGDRPGQGGHHQARQPTVSYGGCPEADAVIRETCRAQGSVLREVEFSRARVRSLGLEGAVFDCAPYGRLTLPLAGAYQVKNAMVAITAAETLAQRGWGIPPEALRRGLAAVSWPRGGSRCCGRRGRSSCWTGPTIPRAWPPRRRAEDAVPGPEGGGAAGRAGRQGTGAYAGRHRALGGGRCHRDACQSPGPWELRSCARGCWAGACPCGACACVAEGLATAALAAGPDGVVCALGSLYLAAAVKEAVKTL